MKHNEISITTLFDTFLKSVSLVDVSCCRYRLLVSILAFRFDESWWHL